MKHILLFILVALMGLAACTPMEEKRDAHMEKAKAFSAEGNCGQARTEARAALDLDAAIPGAFLIMARCDMEDDNYNGAAANFAEVLKLMPDAIEAIEGSARAALMQDDLSTTETFVDKAIVLGDKSSELAVIRAGLLMKQGNFAGAIPLLQQALETDAKNEEALIGLASAYINTGQKDKASALLLHSLEAIPQSSAMYSLLANIAVQDKDYAAAEKNVRKLMELNPGEDHYVVQLADLRFMAGNNAEGTRILEEHLKTTPAADATRIRLASIYTAGRQYEQASAILAAAPAQTPLIRMHAASVLGRSGKLPEAIELLKTLAADPEAKDVEQDVRYGLVEIYLQQERLKDAEEELGKLIAADDNGYEAYALRGRVRFSLQQFDGALQDLEKAANISGDPQALLALAEAYTATGKPQEGEEILTQLISNFPKLGQSYLAMANLHLMRNSPEAALMVLNIGKTAVPDDANLPLTQADILARLGRTQEAATVLEELAKRPEFTETALMRLGAIQGEAKNHDKAAAAYERATKLNPNSTEAAEGRIRALIAGGKAKAALTFAEKRHKDRPQDPAAAYMLGEAGLANKNRDKTLEGLTRAVELAPDWDQPLSILAQIYRSEGKTKEAIDLAKTSMEKAPDAIAPALIYAMLQEQKENFDEAMNVYRQILIKHPENSVAASNLSFLMLRRDSSPEELKQAEILARQALQSGITAARDTIGWAQHLQGNNVEAEKTLRQSREEMNASPLVDYHLAVVLAAMAGQGGEKAAAYSEESKALLLGIIMQPSEFSQKNDARALLDKLNQQQ